MVKGIGIKKEGEVIEYYGITLGDDMVGQGLKKDENGVVSVDVENLEINEEKLVKITWAELKALRDEEKLIAGTFYRITDYVTTTTQGETKSANHPFDVIVLALNENALSEEAKAALHEGDTYFADSDISAWELKYCLDNDKTRFYWADETNGKGVIYRMIDEKRNDCPYDFKNILFYNNNFAYKTTSDKYYYTFSYVISGVLYDGTTNKQINRCYKNKMGEWRAYSGILQLNKNVFKIIDFAVSCHSNNLGVNCYSNTFDNECVSNTFGNNCHSNKFGDNFQNNKFGNDCSSNTFGNHLQNRYLDADKTSITLNEEFYDDGSGQLVPIKHPDLSTQPSILPYKFMGQYVYEQLVHKNIGDIQFEVQLPVEKPIFLECVIVGSTSVFSVSNITYSTGQLNISPVNGSLDITRQVEFARIVYTSMPEENSYYYKEYFNNAAVIRLEGDYTSVQNVSFLGEDIECINYNTYVYRNLSGASNTTSIEIIIENNTGNLKKPKSVKIYLDGVELDSTKVTIQSYGAIVITTPLPINNYNTIEAIINL